MMPRQVEWSMLPSVPGTKITDTHARTRTQYPHQLFLKGGILAQHCPKSALSHDVTAQTLHNKYYYYLNLPGPQKTENYNNHISCYYQANN